MLQVYPFKTVTQTSKQRRRHTRAYQPQVIERVFVGCANAKFTWLSAN
jgi:hypothetical protein